ncbi:S-layer homology domain-containing protein [Pseudalkalibacillus sp. A8]|uniref:S-layer homology domain-containing protein n=1 Tax=Pseudalkalibacillus sp. A8 TaxID=3382641 RepID=UPI0038B4EE3A
MIDNAYNIDRKRSTNGFKDLSNVPWALESILDLSSHKIFNGYTDGTFRPKNNITRAEFSVVLAYTINPDFRPLDDLLVHFIDVGQGDSILLESPSGKTILIDGGRKSAGQVVVDYLATLVLFRNENIKVKTSKNEKNFFKTTPPILFS